MPPPPLQNVLQLGERLERSDARGNSLQRAQKQQARRELCDAVWAENLCDVSVALRGTDFMALGALRLPWAPQIRFYRLACSFSPAPRRF